MSAETAELRAVNYARLVREDLPTRENLEERTLHKRLWVSLLLVLDAQYYHCSQVNYRLFFSFFEGRGNF